MQAVVVICNCPDCGARLDVMCWPDVYSVDELLAMDPPHDFCEGNDEWI